MGKILSGILGGFSGKVGPVVGGKWKSIDYMRSYVIPANPNTPAQQTVRTKFSAIIVFAKALLTSLIQVYWDPFYSDMSGFNAFVSKNYGQLSAGNKIDSSCIMCQGSLEPINSITSAIIQSQNVVMTVVNTIVGNGLMTDSIKIVYYQTNNDVIEFLNPTKTRTDGSFNVTPSATPEEDDIVFLFLHRGTGSAFVVSDSKAVAVTT